jgi:hypothetical protein
MHKTKWHPLNQQGPNDPSKPTKTKKFSLDEILNRRYSLKLKQMQACLAEEMTPPSDEREFEARVGKYEDDLKNKLFGYMYYLKESKTLKRDSSAETIVEFLCEYDKHADELFVITQYHNGYRLLKQILEKDAPFAICQDTYLLGFERDRSGLSGPQMNVIAVQAAAQAIWYLKKHKFPTKGSMIDFLFDKKNALYGFLEMNRFNNRRTIQNWISEVFPLQNGIKKGRPSLKEHLKGNFEVLIPIPGILLEEGRVINVMKLRFAIQCLVRVLKIFGWSKKKIEGSPLIGLYQAPLKYYLRDYALDWIKESLEKNGRIFAS